MSKEDINTLKNIASILGTQVKMRPEDDVSVTVVEPGQWMVVAGTIEAGRQRPVFGSYGLIDGAEDPTGRTLIVGIDERCLPQDDGERKVVTQGMVGIHAVEHEFIVCPGDTRLAASSLRAALGRLEVSQRLREMLELVATQAHTEGMLAGFQVLERQGGGELARRVNERVFDGADKNDLSVRAEKILSESALRTALNR